MNIILKKLLISATLHELRVYRFSLRSNYSFAEAKIIKPNFRRKIPGLPSYLLDHFTTWRFSKNVPFLTSYWHRYVHASKILDSCRSEKLLQRSFRSSNVTRNEYRLTNTVARLWEKLNAHDKCADTCFVQSRTAKWYFCAQCTSYTLLEKHFQCLTSHMQYCPDVSGSLLISIAYRYFVSSCVY